MPGVIEKADELVGAIQQSEEYRVYSELKHFMIHESGLLNRVDSFRSRLFELQSCEESVHGDFEKLRQEYRDILENSQVMAYLSAEQALIDMMRDIYGRIGSAVNLDLSFLGGVKELNL